MTGSPDEGRPSEAASGPGEAGADAHAEALREQLREDVRSELEEAPDAGSAVGAATVRMKDVWLSFGSNEVLRGISFNVRQGETLCILGGSGVGKSTVLRLILRLVTPDRGEVLIEGRDIARVSRDEALELRERMGMVFQGSALFDSLTVEDNVAFPLYEHTSLDDESIRARVEEVLDFVDLDPAQVLELLPAELSGGMRKRVAIARAIVHEPPILLFDEPTSGLDPITTRTIDELILKLRRELDVCVVAVTHDLTSAFRIATATALLYRGEIIFNGAPEEMYACEHEYVKEFLA